MIALLHLAPPQFLDVLLYFQPSLDILLRFNLSLPAEFHCFLVESRSIPLLRIQCYPPMNGSLIGEGLD